jgi:hypothetical protein
MYGTVQQIELPPEARAVATLERPGYTDAFVVDVAPRSAEAWGRAVLEDAPGRTRAALLAGWTSLGLAIDLRLPADHVLGWPVRRNEPDVLLLGAGSRVGMPAQLLFLRRPEGFLFATLVRPENPVARRMWAAIERTHVRTVRDLLEGAGRRVPA